MQVAWPARLESQSGQFAAISADQVLDKETSVGLEFVECARPLGLAIEVH